MITNADLNGISYFKAFSTNTTTTTTKSYLKEQIFTSPVHHVAKNLSKLCFVFENNLIFKADSNNEKNRSEDMSGRPKKIKKSYKMISC